tara:strand:- start:23 stop:373 length:351 start_codon:yes stop_codon:yes gene_type:complete
MIKVKLLDIAYARSGDKGADSNVGIIFKNKDLYQWALANLDANKVKKHFNGIVLGEVIRYELENLNALNFILKDSLGGGGSESLLNDAQGKTHGQALLKMEVELPINIIKKLNEKD